MSSSSPLDNHSVTRSVIERRAVQIYMGPATLRVWGSELSLYIYLVFQGKGAGRK